MTSEAYQQCASAVIMCAPYDFCYSTDSARDNEFMNNTTMRTKDIRDAAMAEFDQMVEKLESVGIQVVKLPRRTDGKTAADAIFVNNWNSSTPDGTLLAFPMCPQVRRIERRVEDLRIALEAAGFIVRRVEFVGEEQEDRFFLEGTGALCIDHPRQIVFGAVSDRCHEKLFKEFVEKRKYKRGVLFETRGPSGKPIYHTNVVMSIGERFAVICLEAITKSEQKQLVVEALGPDREIIDISMEQVAKFCGNIQQLRTADGQSSVIVMSQSAYDGFTSKQRVQLNQHGRLLPCAIPTIEAIGGGSARCMIGEIFLPRRAAQ